MGDGLKALYQLHHSKLTSGSTMDMQKRVHRTTTLFTWEFCEMCYIRNILHRNFKVPQRTLFKHFHLVANSLYKRYTCISKAQVVATVAMVTIASIGIVYRDSTTAGIKFC